MNDFWWSLRRKQIRKGRKVGRKERGERRKREKEKKKKAVIYQRTLHAEFNTKYIYDHFNDGID